VSRQLESLLDRQRRADCAANDGITSAREIRAKGNHLVAQNDEPEPVIPDRQLAEMFAGERPFELADRVCKLCHNSGHNCPECSGWDE
jgi:hypothetical protein